MPFQTRNAYYLRISSNTVLPLYVYLDERHVDWMTDRVLQHVLEDLRPKIPVKLRAEDHINLSSGSSGSAKKGTVDVHRGDTYQFAFFFKYTEPHSLLIKQRNFTLVTEPPPPPPPPEETKPSGRRKKTGSKKRATSSTTTKGANKRRRQARVDSDEEDIAIDISDDEEPDEDAAITSGPRRSSRRAPTRSYREPDDDEAQVEPGPNAADASENDDVEMQDDYAPHDNRNSDPGSSLKESIVKEEVDDASLRFTPAPDEDAEMDPGAAPQMTFDVDEEEPKPKLAVQLKYQGFNITGRCLCIVVEPWPPVRSASRAPSTAPGRAASVRASATPAPSRPEQRQKTPLFLPDYDEDDERNRSVTPAPKDVRMRFSRPPVPLFEDPPPEDDENDEEDEEEGMMQFSQVLSSRSAFARGGTTEEDDEFDGAVLFADADETREL